MVLRLGGVDLTESQLTSIALALFGALMMVRLKRESRA
jgi:hypothetical protein